MFPVIEKFQVGLQSFVFSFIYPTYGVINSNKLSKDSNADVEKSTQQGKTKFFARSEVLDLYVTKLLGDRNLNIYNKATWMPEALESQIYKSIIEKIVNKFFDLISKLDGTQIAGHHIELEIIRGEGTGVPEEVAEEESKNYLNIDNLNIIVERLLSSKSLESSWLPIALQKDLYLHIVYLMLTVMAMFVGSSQCDVIGHRMGVSIDQSPSYFPHTFPSKMNADEIIQHVDSLLVDMGSGECFLFLIYI